MMQRQLPALLLGLAALAGCDRAETGRQGAERGAEPQGVADVPLGAFRPDATEAETPMADRLLADGERAVLVPATGLFPGIARVDPGIENPYADEAAVAAGERHFNAFNCSGCHAPLGGGGMGPPLSDDAWIYGSEPAQIYFSIMQGRPDGMPAWASMLPERTAWEMVAYIQSLGEIEDYASAAGFPRRGPLGQAQPDDVGNAASGDGDDEQGQSTAPDQGTTGAR